MPEQERVFTEGTVRKLLGALGRSDESAQRIVAALPVAEPPAPAPDGSGGEAKALKPSWERDGDGEPDPDADARRRIQQAASRAAAFFNQL